MGRCRCTGCQAAISIVQHSKTHQQASLSLSALGRAQSSICVSIKSGSWGVLQTVCTKNACRISGGHHGGNSARKVWINGVLTAIFFMAKHHEFVFKTCQQLLQHLIINVLPPPMHVLLANCCFWCRLVKAFEELSHFRCVTQSTWLTQNSPLLHCVQHNRT